MDYQRNAELFRSDAEWITSLTTSWLPSWAAESLPSFFKAWFGNYVFGMALYLITGGLWCLYIYYCFPHKFFPTGLIPASKDIMHQVSIGVMAIPFYSLLPTVTDAIVMSGWTKAYPRVDDVGLSLYIGYFILYMLWVEFGVYWMHRLLHDIKPLYKWLHCYHHIYNKAHTLSPMAGLAFHPLDGVLQAVPYTIGLFIVPMHYLTHIILLFLTGIWATSIHDSIDGKMDPIMGAGYHTIHHTSYKDNYGHYFIFMDWIFGTLLTPEEYQEKKLKS